MLKNSLLKRIFSLINLSLLLTSYSIQSMQGGAGAGASASAHVHLSLRSSGSVLSRFFANSTTTKLFKGTAYTAGALMALPASYSLFKHSGSMLKEVGQKVGSYSQTGSPSFTEGAVVTTIALGSLGLAFAGLWALEASYKMAGNAKRNFSEFRQGVRQLFR